MSWGAGGPRRGAHSGEWGRGEEQRGGGPAEKDRSGGGEGPGQLRRGLGSTECVCTLGSAMLSVGVLGSWYWIARHPLTSISSLLPPRNTPVSGARL